MSSVSVRRDVVLAPYTTFKIGGPARSLVEAMTDADVQEAAVLAKDAGLPLFVLGGGSNLLVPDEGVEGVVVRVHADAIRFENDRVIADAGAVWDTVVDEAIRRGLFGIENLAGVPGTIGGAAVQNIGAYGAELAHVFAYADVIDTRDGSLRRVTADEADFGYRTSSFKRHREFVVLRVALQLAESGELRTSYADLIRAQEEGELLSTPKDVAQAVRAIRARKFPDLRKEGTAGSFFKNPVLPQAHVDALRERHPGLPSFPQEGGTAKVSLAWLLDKVLGLKGYAQGAARLYEEQPLVLVAREGATATEVNALAEEVRKRVREATGIDIEREVETFGA